MSNTPPTPPPGSQQVSGIKHQGLSLVLDPCPGPCDGQGRDWEGQQRQHTKAVCICTERPFARCHVVAHRRTAVFALEPVHKRKADHRHSPPAGCRAGPGAHLCWKWLWNMSPPTRWSIFSNKLKNLFILKKLFRFPQRRRFRGGRVLMLSCCGLRSTCLYSWLIWTRYLWIKNCFFNQFLILKTVCFLLKCIETWQLG